MGDLVGNLVTTLPSKRRIVLHLLLKTSWTSNKHLRTKLYPKVLVPSAALLRGSTNRTSKSRTPWTSSICRDPWLPSHNTLSKDKARNRWHSLIAGCLINSCNSNSSSSSNFNHLWLRSQTSPSSHINSWKLNTAMMLKKCAKIMRN